ncbi:MAG TPA: M14 family metallopeptidase [Bacteroidales bacterium]|nr:M14 family metallopeptidase [Bacteroidales bacterium]
MQLKIRKSVITIVLSAILISPLSAGILPDNAGLATRIRALEKNYPTLCSISTLCTTAGGKDIFALTIGRSATENKPGIAIVGGIDGRYIHSREMAIGFAEEILRRSGEPEISALLDEVTFYVLPDVSPDASAQYFSKLKYERNVNSVSTDDDRDFIFCEDPADDLNGDGMITLVRIEDPAGTWISSPADKRIMVAADPAKGEKGSYIVISEGIDNDGDGLYNEDGEGGVAFNANFSHKYEEFGLNSGAHAMSETESRAVADFLYDRFNIYMTIAYGPQDNLSQPMKGATRPPQRGQKPDGMLKSDESINKLASDIWKEKTGIKGSPAAAFTPGNFAEWAYFDYGRYSFSTPGWWIQTEKGENTGVAYMKNQPADNDNFIPWVSVAGDRFGGRHAEVGGIKPFATIVPPDSLIAKIKNDNFSFVTALASFHPVTELTGLKVEKTDDNLWRVTVKVHNNGIFATCTEVGDRNKFIRRAQLTLEPGKDQTLISGHLRQAIPRLDGNQAIEYSWLIMGKGKISIKAGAVNCGFSTLNAELK